MSGAQSGTPSRSRRVTVLAFVLCGLGLAAIGSAVRPARAAAVRSGAQGQSIAYVSSSVRSLAWYCPGPLPIGARPQASSIAIANVADHRVTGEVVIAQSSGSSISEPLTVAASSEAVVGLPRTGARRFAAVTVLANSASVGVEELVHGPEGPVAAPCTTSAGEHAYLTSGDTSGANDVALALFDPGATPAVASVTVSTGAATVSPPAFQGVPIAAGGLVVLNIGHYVSSRALVAVLVQATGGRVVAGAFQTALVSGHLVSALMPASSVARRAWYFAGAPAGGAARQAIDVFNPGTSAAHVLLRLGSVQGVAEATLSVAPGAVSRFTPAPDASSSALRWASVTTTNGVPVVASRSSALLAPLAHRSPVRAIGRPRATGARALTVLPSYGPGFALTSGVRTPERTWLLAGGESDAHVQEAIAITNFGASAVPVTVEALGGALGAGASAATYAQFSGLSAPPHGTTVVNVSGVVGADGVLPLLVSSPDPLVVSVVLYAVGPHSLGFANPVAIPVR